jgi:hypothetical protein
MWVDRSDELGEGGVCGSERVGSISSIEIDRSNHRVGGLWMMRSLKRVPSHREVRIGVSGANWVDLGATTGIKQGDGGQN